MATIRQIQTALDNATKAGDQSAQLRLRQLLEQAQASGAPEGSMPAGEVASRAASNFGSSLYNYGSDMVSAVTHPVQTIQTMGDLGAGAIREGARAILPGSMFDALDSVNQDAGKRASATATAVGRHYSDRYGSVEGFKRGLAEDPVGVMSDLSLPLTGGGGLAARAGGMAGRVGRVAQVAGELMDPVSAVARGGRGLGRAVSSAAGWTSGMGDEPGRAIFNARRAGGEQAAAANRGMRQPPRSDELVQEAFDKAGVLGDEASARYQANIASTRASNARVNWGNVFRSIHDTLRSNMTARGNRFYGGDTGRQMMRDILETTYQYVSDPNLHNLEGLDALKQELSQLQHTMGAQPPRGAENANRLVTNVINGVRQEIIRHEPGYAVAEADWAQWKDLQGELRQALSLNDKAAVDTALRKLQSTMRNNVQTNYGARSQLLDEIDSVSAPAIRPRPGVRGRPELHQGTLRAELAGQAANTMMPRGIARAGSAMALPAAVAWLMGNPGMALGAALTAPMAMPRVVGETAGLLGDAAAFADRQVAANPRAAAVARRVASNPGRQVARQVGVMNDQAEGVIQDANGVWYDAKGRPIE
jgi:hypothetical protein